MPKQKTLADLYVRGKELILDEDDGTGKPLAVWIQKLNPVETSQAARKADAARARLLTIRRNRESEECLAVYSDILALTRDEQIDTLVGTERIKKLPMVEEELATKDEWAENGYLQGLRDSWREGLGDAYGAGEDHPEYAEALRVHDELTRFLDAVVKDTEKTLEDHRDALSSMTDQELEDAVAELHFRILGDRAWLEEFYRAEIWLGVRRADNHRERLFQERSEVDELQIEVIDLLKAAFREITVDPVEGKDSAGIPPSSEPSEAPATAEADLSSGQLVATA